jgi:hypothetical protein
MRITLALAAMSLLASASLANAQGTAQPAPGSGKAPGGTTEQGRCWDTATKQTRDKTATVQGPGNPSRTGGDPAKAARTGATGSGGSAGAGSPGSGHPDRPPGMPDC